MYNLILDTIIQRISSRFEKHGQLCADFSSVDPNNFQTNMPLPTNLLSSIYEKIAEFIPDISLNDLHDEYSDFMIKWNELKKTINCSNYEYNDQISDESNGKKIILLSMIDFFFFF